MAKDELTTPQYKGWAAELIEPNQKLKELLQTFELKGQSLIIQPLEEEKKERTTESGIVFAAEKTDAIELKKGLVVKAGKGYVSEQGKWIPNEIKEGAEVYYKATSKYELEGIKFDGTEPGQVIAYKNYYNEIGQRND